jgi:hypothetical protein
MFLPCRESLQENKLLDSVTGARASRPLFLQRARRPRSDGLTFLELIIAMAILAMVVGMLDTAAQAVHQGFACSEGQATATQHARVALDRIISTASQATANVNFPGLIVETDQVGAWTYPDTLVVWHPAGAPADPTGLPRFNELVIYCPSSVNPNRLLEITLPGNTQVVPAATDQVSWRSVLQSIKQNPPSTSVVVTSLLRTCPMTSGAADVRAALRFQTRLLPSDADWSRYKAGTLAWKALPWAQGLFGSQSGLRQSWLQMELQVAPDDSTGDSTAPLQPATFFGSAALYYQLNQ